MRKIWIAGDTIVSPLGNSSAENFSRIMSGSSSMTLNTVKDSPEATCLSLFAAESPIFSDRTHTRFENIALRSLQELNKTNEWPSDRTLFILSTTKGNIELLEQGNASSPRIHLHATASMLAARAGIKNHVVISNACTSGVVALLVARRYIQSGMYDHAVVLGADVISEFVVSGFRSLHALSATPCKPFDQFRNGINLGEGAGALFLTTAPEKLSSPMGIELKGGGISNDANHISGPSKTGEELAKAIRQALVQSSLNPDSIDLVSAHGTATLYNDEMESKAFHLAGLKSSPLHSLKGYIGHTLGAAGAIETILCAQSLREQELIPSKGYEKNGVSQPLNVIQTKEKKKLINVLKTASGFGGTNAALVLSIAPI